MKKATNIVELETPANNAGEALLRKSSKSQAEKIDILKLNSEMEDQLAQFQDRLEIRMVIGACQLELMWKGMLSMIFENVLIVTIFY